MSRKILDVMDLIFERLKSKLSDDDLGLVADVQRHIQAEGDEGPVCDFVKFGKISPFYRNKEWLCIFEYRDQQYLLLEEKHYNSMTNIGFEMESDVSIIQGAGMLAIAEKHLCIRGNISSLDIIDRCLGIEPDEGNDVTFSFSDILSLFVPYYIFKVDSSRFELTYYEDINRLICYLLADENSVPLSNLNTDRIKTLMLLNSSRSIAATILNGLSSSLIEYTFLQIYQCIEYLFKLNLSFSLSKNHNIPLEKSLGIVLTHEFRMAESENFYHVLKENIPIDIMESHAEILPDTAGLESDIYRRMSTYIYKLRCNVAHLRYKQECLTDVNWAKCIDILLEIATLIFQRRDSEIIQACNNNNTWELL